MFKSDKKDTQPTLQNDTSNVGLNEIGVKGVFLQDMFKAKVLVPAGFIITTAFVDYLEQTGILGKIETLTANNLSIDDMEAIVRVSNDIIELIKNHEMPKSIRGGIESEYKKLNVEFCAIRPSLIGQVSKDPLMRREFTAILNVDNANLIEAIKTVWASFYTPVTIVYRLKNNLKPKDQIGVLLIQKMVDAEVSGISFTSNPISKDNNQVVIEANLGYSETVNRHGIARDTYIADKTNGEILGRIVREQEKMLARVGASTQEVEVAQVIQGNQKLNDSQIDALTKLSIHIEKYYQNVPQKIEWAFSQNKFYILQSQPINE
jgi:pyruvate,water dikinase